MQSSRVIRELLTFSFHLSDPIVSCSRTVATCGGESVCLIDCETGVVLKKYKVATEVGCKYER